MYLQRNGGNLSGLGFTVPSWIRSIVGAVVRGKQVTVPTGAGTITVNLDDPAELARLAAAVKGTRITTRDSGGGGAPGPLSFVDSIPGGWLTILGVGLGAAYLLKRRG